MQEWDTRALHREACDAFTTAYTKAEKGRELLDGISRINYCLQQMEKLTSVTIGSCNDSTWKPAISDEEVKQFVRKTLEAKRDELRAEFNKIR